MAKWKSAAAKRLIEASGNSSMEEAIRKVVSQFLDNVPLAPTNLNILAEKLNVDKILNEEILGSGELRILPSGKYIIVCSTELSKDRINFTIAHEFAHIILSGLGNKLLTRGEELERLCDMCAAEILMPTETFVSALEKCADENVLSKQFTVSKKSVQIRIKSLKNRCVFNK